MSKIAFIGDSTSGLIFKSLGVSVFSEENKEKIPSLIRKLRDQDYLIIFITEKLGEEIYKELEEELEYLPTIVLIPDYTGSKKIGFKRMRESIIKAIGADLLKKE